MYNNAEREGFKPPVPITVHLVSNQAHSITLTPLRELPGQLGCKRKLSLSEIEISGVTDVAVQFLFCQISASINPKWR